MPLSRKMTCNRQFGSLNRGLRQETAREDMVRCAMRVYGAAGRRRDVVELYSGHMHHLREQVQGVPEPETRRLYERLVEGRLKRVLVER